MTNSVDPDQTPPRSAGLIGLNTVLEIQRASRVSNDLHIVGAFKISSDSARAENILIKLR